MMGFLIPLIAVDVWAGCLVAQGMGLTEELVGTLIIPGGFEETKREVS